MFNQHSIDDYFNKSFEFSGNKHWSLPAEAYKTSSWRVDSLQQMKSELNCVKGQLSNFSLENWSKHTRFRDPSSSIISTLKTKGSFELLTQAWCKFYECLSRYPVVPEIATCQQAVTSLHLCEAPGAFVSALNRFLYTHHRKLEWSWVANTLNPYYEGNPPSDMIADDRLIRHTLEHWDFGVDLSGDLTKYYNHEALVQKAPFMVITADGSVDCMKNPGEQENIVHFLHYCEAMTALRVLEKWGSFVLKLFTMFEHGTICLMYLLTCCFMKVHVFKPCSSKSGNSEVYVICLGFKGWGLLESLWSSLILPYQNYTRIENTAMFAMSEIDPEFLCQLENCAKFFMNLQTFTINENVRHFIGQAQTSEEEINLLKVSVAERFIRKYRMAFHIPKRYKMILSYEKHNRLIQEEWNFRMFTAEDILVFDSHQLDIRIGKALITVTKSHFCQVKFDVSTIHPVNNSILEQAMQSFLTLNYKKICCEEFRGLPQKQWQRTFFSIITSAVENHCNLLIISVPLLTRFLVGLMYILTIGYEYVIVYKDGVIFFRTLRLEKYALINRYLRMIKTAHYRADHETNFLADVLEIIPQTVLEGGIFYEAVCRYNNGIFTQGCG